GRYAAGTRVRGLPPGSVPYHATFCLIKLRLICTSPCWVRLTQHGPAVLQFVVGLKVACAARSCQIVRHCSPSHCSTAFAVHDSSPGCGLGLRPAPPGRMRVPMYSGHGVTSEPTIDDAPEVTRTRARGISYTPVGPGCCTSDGGPLPGLPCLIAARTRQSDRSSRSTTQSVRVDPDAFDAIASGTSDAPDSHANPRTEARCPACTSTCMPDPATTGAPENTVPSSPSSENRAASCSYCHSLTTRPSAGSGQDASAIHPPHAHHRAVIRPRRRVKSRTTRTICGSVVASGDPTRVVTRSPDPGVACRCMLRTRSVTCWPLGSCTLTRSPRSKSRPAIRPDPGSPGRSGMSTVTVASSTGAAPPASSSVPA